VEKAVAVYQKILSREPDETDVLVILGDLLPRLGRKAEGLEFLRQAAGIFTTANETQKAISIYKKYIQYSPGNLDMLNALAELLLKANNPVEAGRVLLQAAQLSAADDPTKAIFYYEKVLKGDPGNLDSLAALGELYSKQKLLPKALEYNFLAGKKYFEKGQYASSYSHLAWVIQHEPANRPANVMILDTLIRLKSYEDALTHLQGMGASFGEDDAELLRYRATILFELDRREDLKNLLHRMTFISHEGHNLVFQFVERALEKKNLSLAVELIDLLDLSQYHLFNTRINDALNAVLAVDENHAGALQKLLELKVFIGDLASVRSLYPRLYQIYLNRNENRKAYHLLEKWINVDEDNDWIRQELRRLKLILEEEATRGMDLIRGKLEDIDLVDVIQMLDSARKSGILQIRYSDRQGRIYFQNGTIIHAAFKDAVGEAAILQLFRLKGGDFMFETPLPAEVVHTLHNPNTQIVLDALRVIDEESQNKPADQP